jgi:hypothetical protein
MLLSSHGVRNGLELLTVYLILEEALLGYPLICCIVTPYTTFHRAAANYLRRLAVHGYTAFIRAGCASVVIVGSELCCT